MTIDETLYRYRVIDDRDPAKMRGSYTVDQLKKLGLTQFPGHYWEVARNAWILLERPMTRTVAIIEPVNPEPYDPRLEPHG